MIATSDLATHWGLDPSAVSQLRRRRQMPEFATLADADAWRAVNVKARSRRRTSSLDKIAPGNHNPDVKLGAVTTTMPEAQDGDFASWLCAAAEHAAKLAAGRLSVAMSGRNDVEAAGALRIFAEAAGRCRKIREDALRLGENERSLIQVDLAMDVVGIQLQELRNHLTGLGQLLGSDANPGNPILAQQVIDAEVDRIFGRITAVQGAVAADLGKEFTPACSAANTALPTQEQNHEP